MQENKRGTRKEGKLIWSMGLPRIVSRVLQALYNVVDTVFVINRGEKGTLGNLALSAAFPVQILRIAIGVGTGVGLNAKLSRNLGEKKNEEANQTAGNGLFLALCFYLLFLLFGLFLTKPYRKLRSDNPEVIERGSDYLSICCTLSIGSIGYAVVERFLMSTGKTGYSRICQISGALINILLDYVFIYPRNLGIKGAAYATIIGQIFSLLLALIIHYTKNKEINVNLKYRKPNGKTILEIYKIGFPAFLRQARLSVMMFAVLLIIGTCKDTSLKELLSGSYGIYYKLRQIARFAAFGLSNATISIVSYNYGRKNRKRVKNCAKQSVLATRIVTFVITILYESLAGPISSLFALTVSSSATEKDELINRCKRALYIASSGYIFMGICISIQGVLQGLNKVYSPVLISFFRLLLFPLPFCFLFLFLDKNGILFWAAFPIAEVITCGFAFLFLHHARKSRPQAKN